MKKYFKKGLSVFLSLLMVFTSLVFVVPEFKAEAVSAGKYYVKITYYCDDAYDGGNAYTGPNFTGEGAGFTVYYAPDNGTGTETYDNNTIVSVTEDCKSAFDSKSVIIECSGFPTKVIYYNRGGFIFSRTYGISKVEVSSSSNGAYSTLWEGSVGADAASTQWKATIDSSGAVADNTGTGGWYAMSTKTRSWNVPIVDDVNWISADTAAQTIYKTNGASKTFKYNIVDQYDVVLSDAALSKLKATPTVTVSGSESGTIETSGNIYHKNTNGTSEYQEVITATPNGQGTTWDNQTITIKVVAGTGLSDSMEYILNDDKYTYTLDANTGSFAADAVTQRTDYYYNTYGNLPTPTKEGYTFRGFYTTKDTDFSDEAPAETGKLTISTPMTSDTTWYASWKINSYKAVFEYRTENGWVTSDSISANYGTSFKVPDIVKVVDYNDVRYTFTGWSPVLSVDVNGNASMPAVSQTYKAQYGEEALYADYTKVTEAINAANEIMADDEYEAMYTEASRSAITIAINYVKYNLGLSKQSEVDGYADAINNAVAKLEKNKYVVLFLDDNGDIITDGYHFVEYGEAVEVPTTPEKAYDADKHYTFDKWDEDTSACSKVTDDLVFTALFTEADHDYETSTVPSTCTADGVTLYECKDCDYSYTVANENDPAGHTWETEKRVILDATCGTAGLKATFCSVCDAIDATSFETYTDDSEHAWVEETPIVATCNNSGIKINTCSICGEVKYELTEKEEHSWGTQTIISAKCTTAGYTLTPCTKCDFVNVTRVEPAIDNHTLVKTTLDPTCTKPGYKTEKCYYCDYVSTEILETIDHNIPEEWTTVKNATCGTVGILHKECTMCKGEDQYDTIPATGEHTWGEWVTTNAPKCGTEGVETRTCSVCKTTETQAVAALEHKWVAYPTNTVAPTCETTGFDAEICDNCGDTRGTVTSKLGHKFEMTSSTTASCTAGATETWTCKNDATHTYTIITSVPNEHSYTGTVITQATCTDPQITLYTCQGCGRSHEIATASPNGHNYIDNWQTITSATETTNGEMVRYCTVCNKAPEYVTIPATGAHVFEKGEYIAPECEKAGSQAWVCTTHEDCEENYVDTIPATGHKLILNTKDASCTEAGYVNVVCGECGEEIDSYEIPMLSHSYTEVEGSRVAPTCTEPGKYTTKCACGDEQEIAIPATGHTHTTEDIAATCTSGAKTVYTCHCGDSYAITTSDPLEHKWTEWVEVTPATADTAGVQRRECACEECDCGKYEEAPIPPNGGHIFEKDVEASTNATCEEAGKIVYKCTADHNCGVTYTHDVAATGHQLKLEFKNATCTEDGYANVYCTSCLTYIERNTIDKLGHKYTAEVTTPAKCGEAGEITYTCENCGDTYTEKVDALEHNFIVEVEGTRVAPTCIVDGKVTMKCINCDETQENKLPKTGHAYDDGKVIVKPDCVTAGKIEYTCEYDHTHKFTEIVEPTGAHSLVGEQVSYEATCETGAKVEQYCEACNNWVTLTEFDGEPLGHDWSEWVVTVQPTDTEDGHQYRTCQRKNCGAKEEMTLTAGRTFLVTFYRHNGERITQAVKYTYGSKVEIPDAPSRRDDEGFTYKFVGWKYRDYDIEESEKMLDYIGYGMDYSKQPGDEGYEEQENLVKQMAFVAEYEVIEKIYSKVTYIDGNGNSVVFSDNKDYCTSEETNHKVSYNEIDTAYQALFGAPKKDSTEVYNYTFSGWQIQSVKDETTGEYEAVATAVFTANFQPGQGDDLVKEPSALERVFQLILNFFKSILSLLGINI